ncbi:MAG: cellobiose phosphorylase, partial [Promethearchaeota archaeon]
HIWLLMMVGKNPFTVEDNQLCLEFRPILPSWLFDEKGIISFNFLGNCNVIYNNPQKLDTFNKNIQIKEIDLEIEGEGTTNLKGSKIRTPFASLVRSGKVKSISIFFESIETSKSNF